MSTDEVAFMSREEKPSEMLCIPGSMSKSLMAVF